MGPGRDALARGARAAQAHAADLGSRGPGQPARRRPGRAQDDAERPAARVPELRPLGTDRGSRGIRDRVHRLPGRSRREDEGMTIDIKSMGYIRVASTDLSAWTTFAGKVLGLAEGRGPNPDNQYWRIDAVSARLVVFPSDVDQLDATGWEVADHQALQSAREHLKEAGVVFEEGTP